jgi:mono/diheme cytochrome c family protein
MTTEAMRTAPKHSRIGLWFGLGAILLCIAAVAFIAANRPAGQSLATVENKKQVELGEATYQKTCLACHGLKLKGKPSWEVETAKQAGIPLSADGTTWHLSDQRLFDAIASGVRVKGGKTKRIHDTAFGAAQGGKLSDKEIWALIAYFKTTWTARQFESQKETSLRERPVGSTAPGSK